MKESTREKCRTIVKAVQENRKDYLNGFWIRKLTQDKQLISSNAFSDWKNINIEARESQLNYLFYGRGKSGGYFRGKFIVFKHEGNNKKIKLRNNVDLEFKD